MHKSLLTLCILSAFAVTGCGSESAQTTPDNPPTAQGANTDPQPGNPDPVEPTEPTPTKPTPTEPAPTVPTEPAPDPETKAATEKLIHTQNAKQLEDYIKQGLINTQNQQLEQIKNGMPEYYYDDVVMMDGAPAVSVNAAEVAVSSESTAPDSAVSSTNVQVQGVDELDRLKNNKETLFFVDTSNNAPTIQIHKMSDDPAQTTPLANIPLSQDQHINGLYLSDSQLVSIGNHYHYINYQLDSGSAPVTSPEISAIAPCESYADCGGPDLTTEIIGFDISDTQNPTQQWTINIDGNLLGTRKIANTLYIVSQKQPYDIVYYPYDESQVLANIDTINALSIDDLLPQITINDQTLPLVDAANCYIPNTLENSVAYQPAVTTITAIDLTDITQRSSSCYAGDVSGIYATKNAVYLAAETQPHYLWWWADSSLTEETEDPATENEFDTQTLLANSRQNTLVHKFGINNLALDYRGSAAVPGSLYSRDSNVSYRMGENGDYLNIVTTYGDWGETHHRLTVLAEAEQSTDPILVDVAHLPNASQPDRIGKPNESIYSVRFFGDRAYIVTFKKTDPLYVIDLSNNEKPFISGELEIPGYSGYLHPVDNNLLLGVGKEAADQGNFALFQGLKVALFDVSDITSPKELTSISLGKRGTDSAVLNDFHALTYISGYSVDKFTLPISLHGGETYVPVKSWEYYPWLHNGLYTFELTKGDAPELINKGAMIVESDNSINWNGWDRYSYFDRSVLQGKAIHYLHNNTLFSAAWDEIDGEVSVEPPIDPETRYMNGVELWHQAELSDYSFVVTINAFDNLGGPVRVEVMDNLFYGAQYVTGEKVPKEVLEYIPTSVEALFSEAKISLIEPNNNISVEYNKSYGFPEHIIVNEELIAVDDGYEITISDFIPFILTDTKCDIEIINNGTKCN